MTLKLMAPVLLAFASLASAQTPIPHNPDWCGVPDRIDGRSPKTKAEDFGAREFSVPGSGICARYTFGGGWERPMLLQLGEGASDYLPLIELAVKSWNEAVQPWGQDPLRALIQISDVPPTNFELPENFWEDRGERSTWENQADFENVIYFSPYPENSRLGGFTTPTIVWDSMATADIYINTADQEKWSGHTLTVTKKIINVTSSSGVYAYLDHTYQVILHELGHAIGLRHIPVVGNVMKTGTFIYGIASQWTEAMGVGHISNLRMHDGQASDFELTFARPHSKVFPYMALRAQQDLALTDFYTRMSELGEQEKMLLSCIYQVY